MVIKKYIREGIKNLCKHMRRGESYNICLNESGNFSNPQFMWKMKISRRDRITALRLLLNNCNKLRYQVNFSVSCKLPFSDYREIYIYILKN